MGPWRWWTGTRRWQPGQGKIEGTRVKREKPCKASGKRGGRQGWTARMSEAVGSGVTRSRRPGVQL